MIPVLKASFIGALFAIFCALGPFPSPVHGQNTETDFSGELNVCKKVERAVRNGETVGDALLTIFMFYGDQPPELLPSIQRDIVFHAVQTCHYDGIEVIKSALRYGIPIPLLAQAMEDSGVNTQTIRQAFKELGVSDSLVAEVVGEGPAEGQAPTLDKTRTIPPPFEVSQGLGPAISSPGTPGSPGGPVIPPPPPGPPGLPPASPFIP